MSEDSFGADDSLFLDDAAFAQLESIESSAVALHASRAPAAAIPSSDGYFDSIPLDQLAALDSVTVTRSASRPSSSRPKASSSSSQSLYQTHLSFRRENQSTKGKRWDRTAFSATGRRKIQPSKSKGRAAWGDEQEEEEEGWDEGEPLLPEPACDLHQPYGPARHRPNTDTVRSYLYPTNRSKRDYQYEIVKAALTDNCLVALPTGLGKTFIAGVVMLNYYRWFPSAKIVFLAPTKPLVQQQIQACHATCGIPQEDAAVMTGAGGTSAERAVMWRERRVFYCTPQTLMNDLRQRAVDPHDIVLAVFDEAHKASGNYAYTTINAYLMAHHPYFRVLALTATPGADVPKVQAVVDALHISRIEIREAEAPEIRKYMNEKVITKHIVKIEGVVADFRDRWVKLMKPYVGPLVNQDILNNRDLDCARLRSFRILSLKQELGRKSRQAGGGASVGRFFPALTTLGTMATAMGYLLEFSISMFSSTLQGMAGSAASNGKKTITKGGTRALKENREFRQLNDEAEEYVNNCTLGRFGLLKSNKHPKMEKTLELLLAYFAQAEEDAKIHGTVNDTRAMVFCSFRACVLDIVDMLNEHSGLLKATKFVGQQKGKSDGDKGFTQKDQKQTVKDFVEGKYNILVSTSIGEEGLDIGEVDMVICYDMPKTSIKLLQRIGRTGRKRQGQVHVLMAEGREDSHWESAQQTHREIQHEIMHSRNLQLFDDVERLLPPGQLPACIEQKMVVHDWKVDEPRKKRASLTSVPKRPRGEPVPEGAQEGFESVRDILERKTGNKAPTRSRAKPKAKAKGKAKGNDADDAMSLSGDELPGIDELLKRSANSDSDSDDEAAAVKPPAKKSRKAPAKKTTAKKVLPSSALPPPVPQTRTSGIDFLIPEPVNRPVQTPWMASKLPKSPSPDAVLPSSTSPSPPPRANQPRAVSRLPPDIAAQAGFSQIDMSYVLEESDDEIMLRPKAAPVGQFSTPRPVGTNMQPPPVPSSPSIRTEGTPFPVRRIGLGARRRRIVTSSSDAASPHVPRRVGQSPDYEQQSANTEEPPVLIRGRRRLPKQRLRQHDLMELDAEISGSDSADEPSSDNESESDRRFVNDFQATQAPNGYNQQAAYVAGLATQALGKRGGPSFAPRDRTQKFLAKARKPMMVTDDDRSEGEASHNEYELGSFVCDDEELEFAPSSQSERR